MEENILKESTQKIKKQELDQGKENKKIKGIRKIKQEIKARLINGESVKEIKLTLSEKLSQDEIETICNKYKELSLLAKGMPTGKLAEMMIEKHKNESEEEYKKRIRTCQLKYTAAIRENNLREKIELKKEEIKRRLEEGQTPEQILQDKELNVCEEAVKKIEGKINKKIDIIKQKKEVRKRFIEGYSIEDLDKSTDIHLPREILEKIYKKSENVILLAKAMPIDILVAMKIQKKQDETEEEYKRRINKFKRNCSSIISINNLKEEIELKRKQIQKRLLEGQSKESILLNRELNVCIEAIEYVEKIEKEKNEKTLENEERLYTSSKKFTKTNSKKISKFELLKQNYKKLYEDGVPEEISNNKNIDVKKLDKQISDISKRLEGAKVENKESKKIARKLAYYINQKIDLTEDLEELQHLNKMFSDKIRKSFTSINIILAKLDNKISEQYRKNAISQIKRVPDKIQLVIKDLAKGKLDIKLAQEIIEEEAKNRVNNAPKNNFVLTEERQKRQIMIQIRENLKNNTEEYPIENPENTIIELNKLSGNEDIISVDTVVRHLVKRKKFEEAKDICNKYTEIYQNKGNEIEIKAIIALSRYIKNEELGDLILRAIRIESDKQSKSKEEFWKMIEKGIESKRIKLSAIPLGKSQSGKYIFLKDVWPDDDKKVIYR